MPTMPTTPTPPVDVLFISERALWPADQGYRVHGPQMARALAQRGLRVAMATMEPTRRNGAPSWLTDLLIDWPEADADEMRHYTALGRGPIDRLRRRVIDHQGIDLARFAGTLALVQRHRPALVVALGQHGPVALAPVRRVCPDVVTLWYAADELVSFELSCLRREPVWRWSHRLRMAGVYLLLERLFGAQLHGAIGVSPADTARLRRIGGMEGSVLVRNGVDLDHFAVPDRPAEPFTIAFWGRMDFEPNVDAATWFARAVWPRLRQRHPEARWVIAGRHPAPAVRRLRSVAGVEVMGEVPDVREVAARASAVVLPMRCGGGIKNKLLEAAAMGRPIAASPRAVQGLDWSRYAPEPVLVCRSVGQWVGAIERLWTDEAFATALGHGARQWVERHHAWSAAAGALLEAVRPHLPAGRYMAGGGAVKMPPLEKAA